LSWPIPVSEKNRGAVGRDQPGLTDVPDGSGDAHDDTRVMATVLCQSWETISLFNQQVVESN